MRVLQQGTVLVARFPFSDLSGDKLRPVVLLVESHDKDLIVACVSSKTEHISPYCIFFDEKEEEDFLKTGLKRSSIVRVDRIATLERSIVDGEIGVLSSRCVELLEEKLRMLFHL